MTTTPTWVPLADAAAAMQLSERTIRRRVQAGRLDARPGPDGRTMVRLPEEATAPAAMLAAVEAQVESSQELAATMAATHRTLAEVHRDTLTRLQDAEREVRRRTLVAWLSGSVAAATLTAAVVVSVVMSTRVRTADGHAVREAEERRLAEDRLQLAQAGLAAAERQAAATASDLAASEGQVGHLADMLSAVERERDRLAGDLDAARRELTDWRIDLVMGRLATVDASGPEHP